MIDAEYGAENTVSLHFGNLHFGAASLDALQAKPGKIAITSSKTPSVGETLFLVRAVGPERPSKMRVETEVTGDIYTLGEGDTAQLTQQGARKIVGFSRTSRSNPSLFTWGKECLVFTNDAGRRLNITV